MSKAKKLEYHFAATFRERIVAPAIDSLKIYGSYYLGTFYPKTTEEVQLIIKYCNQNKIKIIQQHLTVEEKMKKYFIIISLTKMTSIEVIEEDRTVVLDTGVETSDLLGLLEFKKFCIPCLSINSRNIFLDILNDPSLNQSYIYPYGSLSSFVLGLEGVLGSGEIIKFGSYAYQDTFSDFLKQMMLGTYGQYGIITKIKLKILPFIPHSGLMMLEVHNLGTGIKILQKLSKSSIQLEDVYFFDRYSLQKLSEYKNITAFKEFTPFVLFLTVRESSLEESDNVISKIERYAADFLEGIISIQTVKLPEEVDKKLAWKKDIDMVSTMNSYNKRVETFLLSPSKFEHFISDLEYIKKDFGVDFLFVGSLQNGTIDVHFMNLQDEIGLVWNTFQHEIRAKVLDVLYVYGGRPMHYCYEEQSTIESFFMGSEAFNLSQKIRSLCDPENILVPTNQFRV